MPNLVPRPSPLAAALLLSLAAPAALAQERSFDLAPFRALLAPEAESCAESEGRFEAPDWAFSRHVDFNADGVVDVIFDGSEMTCAPMASFFSGTGGSPRIVFISTKDAEKPWERHDFFGHAHAVVSAPGGSVPVLMISLHGSFCDTYGAAPCVGAWVWSVEYEGKENFLSIVQTPDAEDEDESEGDAEERAP